MIIVSVEMLENFKQTWLGRISCTFYSKNIMQFSVWKRALVCHYQQQPQ